MTRQFELIELVKSYDPEVDETLINRAYVFSMKVHGKQKRASGEPYFTHPIAVARILADMRMDSQTIATGLLHDTVEDTLSTIEEIEDLFGKSVAHLVNGVTKLSELEVKSVHNHKAENLRKLFVAMAEDIRVLLVKLADRLHNMRTLNYVREEKQKRISSETLEIYVPLAERMGMHQIKEEMENLAFAYLHPHAYNQLQERLTELHQKSNNFIEKAVHELKTNLQAQEIKCTVLGREKSAYSIWNKIKKKNASFEQISDIVGFRIIVTNLEDCYRALGIIHHEYLVVPGRFKDYISTPKPNGYQSLHTVIIGPFNQRIEIQIRTQEMETICEDGLASHINYKEAGRKKHAHQYLWLKKVLHSFDEMDNPEDFVEHAKLSMFEDEVFCFTPDGDLISLPSGATVLDFAFAIHSGLGECASKAKVDGQYVPLNHVLENGVQVEIITAPDNKIIDAWTQFVTTNYAKSRIRSFLKKQKKQQLCATGKQLLDKYLKKKNLSSHDTSTLIKTLNVKSIDQVYVALAEGRVGVSDVCQLIETKPFEGPLAITESADEITNTLAPICGIENHTFELAKCCLPLPGDEIVGVVHKSSKGKKIKIHLKTCKSRPLSSASYEEKEVSWQQNMISLDTYIGQIKVAFHNSGGKLAELLYVIHQQNISLENLKMVKRNENIWEVVLHLYVANREQLMTLIAVLKTQTFIENAERI